MVYIILPLKENYMIPKFNKYGNLPDGIYKVTLKEIKKKFGSESQQRKILFKYLKSLAKLLSKNKIITKRFIIDGSFVTDIEYPGDIDCIIIFRKSYSDNSLLAKKIKKIKIMSGFDILIFTEKEPYLYNHWIKYFSHTRDRKIKGLLEVNYD